MRSRGPLDAVTGVVGDAAGALRRRREARRPYAKVYAADGDPRVLDPEGEQARDLLDTAGAMVDAAAPDPAGGRAEDA
jgi:hypothetical protein